MPKLCCIRISYKDKLFLVKIVMSGIILLFTTSLINFSLLLAIIRECTLPKKDDVHIPARILESFTIVLLWISMAPLAVLPYIHSGTSEDVGELLHLPCSCCFGKFECSKVVVFILALFLTLYSCVMFFYNLVIISVAYNTYPEGVRDTTNTIGTIILGIGIFLFAEMLFDSFYGFGNVIQIKVADRIYRKNMIRVNNQKQAVFDVLLKLFKKNRGSFYSMTMIRSLLERDDRLDKVPKNAVIFYCMKAIPGISYREHQRSKVRIYGLKSLRKVKKSQRMNKKKPQVISNRRELEKMIRAEEEEELEREKKKLEERMRKVEERKVKITQIVPFNLSSSSSASKKKIEVKKEEKKGKKGKNKKK